MTRGMRRGSLGIHSDSGQTRILQILKDLDYFDIRVRDVPEKLSGPENLWIEILVLKG